MIFNGLKNSISKLDLFFLFAQAKYILHLFFNPSCAGRLVVLDLILKKLLSKPLNAKGATDKLYDIIGDDELFDQIDDFADTEPKADVRSMVRTAMKRLGIKEETILERIDKKLKERKNG